MFMRYQILISLCIIIVKYLHQILATIDVNVCDYVI